MSRTIFRKKQTWISILGFVALVLHSLGVFTLPLLPQMRQALADTESKWADSLLSGTPSGNPGLILGATDGLWGGTTNAADSWTARWSMENPSGGLSGTQTVNVLARKGTNSGNPTVAINLYENGSLVQSIVGNTSVTSTSSQTVSGTFSAAAVTNRNNVEIELVVTGAGGSPSARNSAQIDSIQWSVNFEYNITVGTEGTQNSTLNIGSTASHVGGAFSFVRDGSSANVTQIIVSETGTVDANADLSNLQILYKAEVTCSSTIPGDATVFNASGVSFSSSQATATGTMSVGTSKICVYVRLDIGAGASASETLEIEITNPSSHVTTSAGTVSPATAVAVSGTTTLQVPPCPSTDQAMRHGNWFNGGTEQSLTWADANCSGSPDILLAANHGESSADTSSTTIAHSTSGAVAAGNMVLLDVIWFGTGTVQSVSGGGLSWQIDVNASPNTDKGVALISAIAPSGLSNGTTITVTFTAAQTDRGLGVTSWSGIKSSSYVGLSGTHETFTTAWTSDLRTLTAKSLLVAVVHEDSSGDHSSTPTSPAIEIRDAASSTFDDWTAAYRVVNTSGSYEVAGTWSTGASANSIGWAEYLAQ